MMKEKVMALAEKWNVNGNFCATVNGKELFSAAHGFVNEEEKLPYTEKSRTYVASVTKQFTAVCIMMLHEQGRLDIDDKLDKYIPEYYLANRVTLRQLLNMTSGIPNQLSVIGERLRKRRGDFDMTDSEFERMVAGLPFTKRVVECPEGTVRKAVMRNEFMTYPLHRWPEGRASKLAEKLVEKLDGEAL